MKSFVSAGALRRPMACLSPSRLIPLSSLQFPSLGAVCFASIVRHIHYYARDRRVFEPLRLVEVVQPGQSEWDSTG